MFVSFLRRYRMVSLLLLVALVSSSVMAYGSGRKLFIPFVVGDDPALDNRSADLRVDNIALGSLDLALYNFGIENPSTRYAIYQWEVARRGGGGGVAPDGYPAPEASPDQFTFRNFTGCQLGQGCFIGWKSSGHMQSRIRYADILLFELWSVGVLCPINLICTVISTRGPTNNTPQPRTILEFEVRGTAAPIQFLNRMCSF